MPIFYQPLLAEGTNWLDADESRHAVHVLRLREGDTIELTDGKGSFCTAFVEIPDSKKCSFRVIEKIQRPQRSFQVHLAVAPTKNMDRIEWLIEKAVEIGIEKITLMQCERSERRNIPLDRIQKIAISALKQSKQAWMPHIKGIVNFKQVLEEEAVGKFIAFVDENNQQHLKDVIIQKSNYLVLIGPEGDFTHTELGWAIEKGFKKVSLGPNRLRTETAALAAVHILSLQ
ncbi:MAG: 16S rRNA (uracil(1498)-N(3))-methyltransferase [Flammeovirgaceae bacterium]